MSQDENVEIVRRAVEAFNRGDFAAALRDAPADATIDMSRSRGPDVGVYAGHDAIRNFWIGMTDGFEGHTMVADELVPHGDHVVVSITAHLTARGGIEVEAKSATVATLRDGHIVRWTMYQDRMEALKAVGLAD